MDAEPRTLALPGWTLNFDAQHQWLVLTDPNGASMVVAANVDREYGGDIARRWREAEAPADTGLDTERLIAAVANTDPLNVGILRGTTEPAYYRQRGLDIAAEYARLGEGRE